MVDRWRGRRNGLAIALVTLVAALSAALGPALAAGPAWQLVVRDASGREVASIPVDSRFTLRYRNSLYGSLAEERFEVTGDGRLRLVELAADELAVLEEYYEIDGQATPRAGDARAWVASPRRAVELVELRLAATDLGERTLIAPGEDPIALWRLAEDAAPTLTLSAAAEGEP